MANWAKHIEDTTGLPVFKRAKHGIHFQRPDGQIEASFSGKPCHYLDGGIYKPIDTKLLLMPDGFYGCPHSKVKVHPDGRVAVAGTGYAQRVELPSAKTGLADGDKLIREFSFGKQEMRITEDGFRSEITLNRIPTLTEARKLVASESGTLSKEYLKSLTTATDANGDVHTVTTLSAFRTWLASAKFPVVIDPDFAGVNTDCMLSGNAITDGLWTTARNTYRTYTTTNPNYVGTRKTTPSPYFYCYRAYLLFDTSAIGAGSTVTQANLKLVCTNDYSDTNFDIQIVKYDWSELAADLTNGTKRETAYDGCLSGTADDAIWRNTNGMSVNTQYASGNLSTAWVSKTGTTYYGLRSNQDYDNTEPTNNRFVGLASNEHATESYRPVLTVTYAAAGIFIPINMNAQMQALTGGMRG